MKRGFLTKCASCNTTPLKGPELLFQGPELLYKGPELKCKHVTTYWMEDGVGVEGGCTGGGGGGGDAAGGLERKKRKVEGEEGRCVEMMCRDQVDHSACRAMPPSSVCHVCVSTLSLSLFLPASLPPFFPPSFPLSVCLSVSLSVSLWLRRHATSNRVEYTHVASFGGVLCEARSIFFVFFVGMYHIV